MAQLHPWIASTLGSVALVAASLAGGNAQDEDEPVRDGKWLYTRNCSGCHNDNGDGRGATILQLGLTARDFKQGGFAFGDTREQMIRTVSTGIPGRSPMPSFKGILSDEDLGLVVDYARTLMPPRKDEAPKNTVMVVKDRPVIARGKLPPIVEGAKEVPRGLLIGTPQGMTFEYDLDGVKLLGVRLGAFADREDWHDRGGGYLKPLGQLVSQEIDRRSRFAASAIRSRVDITQPCHSVLRSARVQGGVATLAYAVIDASGSVMGSVEESCHATATSVGAAFTRSWNCNPAEGVMLHVGLVEGDDVLRWKVVPISADAVPFEGSRLAWWTKDRGELGIDCVLTRSSLETDAEQGPASAVSKSCGSSAPFHAEVTTLRLGAWSSELGDTLAQEILK